MRFYNLKILNILLDRQTLEHRKPTKTIILFLIYLAN